MVELANKAVRSYVGKRFPQFFTNEDVQDLVQDAVSRMWEKRDTFDPAKGNDFAWAWTISKNKVLDAAASKARRTGIFEHFEDGEIPTDCRPYMVDTDDFEADRDLLYEEHVNDMFDSLRSERDKLLLAWTMDGLDAKEIAERLGIPVSTVYMATHHMRERLRKAGQAA
jgi:RNA polymerase sigma-70 factor (ECF subfamily)